SLEVGGGDVVQHQRTVLEMAAGQLVFDEGLLAAEPVEGGVDLAGGGAAEHSRGGQLGGRIEQSGEDQRKRQVAPAWRGSAWQQVIEADAPGGGEGGEHVAMR